MFLVVVTLHTQYKNREWGIVEVQLIGNIWVIVGSTPTSSRVGWDLTVPSEVTALTSAGVHACSCQRHGLVEKRGQSQTLQAIDGTAAFDGSSVDSQHFSGGKIQPVIDTSGTKKKWPCSSSSKHLGHVVPMCAKMFHFLCDLFHSIIIQGNRTFYEEIIVSVSVRNMLY